MRSAPASMTSPAPLTSPVRQRGTRDESGYILLDDPQSTYRDGGEQSVLSIVQAAADISSTSDEMIRSAKTWAERYHLDPARANVLRALTLPPDAHVLEIGAGCGTITRYLAESCALVDAVEPVPARAKAAVARLRDLSNAEVFVGMLADVPPVPAYDVVVVIGVLEYVGSGTSDPAPYLQFLSEIYARLNEGGHLVLAIENKLGVKYVVGAPEDHTSRVFDSIESYPVGGKARTFSRRELEALMASAGLSPSTLVAFPDYKMTRTVMGAMPASCESLLHRLPRFPSPDWSRPRPKLADEAAVWRSLVDAGLSQEFGNSFVVIAGKGTADISTLWPQDRLAAFYSHDRRSDLTAETIVADVNGTIRFQRHGVREANETNGVRLIGSDCAFQPGRDLLDVVAEGGMATAAQYLPRWRTLVETGGRSDVGVALDLVPHNLIVDEHGELQVIDSELYTTEADLDAVLRRGLYWFALQATRHSGPQHWLPHTTVREVMTEFGSIAGLGDDGSWIDVAVDEEAALATRVRTGPPTGVDLDTWRDQLAAGLRANTTRRLAEQSFGDRLPEHHQAVNARIKQRDAEVKQLKNELAKSKAALRSARAATASARARKAVSRALPKGTRRRRLVDSLRQR